jgi:hypothetical protein
MPTRKHHPLSSHDPYITMKQTMEQLHASITLSTTHSAIDAVVSNQNTWKYLYD